jgi:hypothetical protein
MVGMALKRSWALLVDKGGLAGGTHPTSDPLGAEGETGLHAAVAEGAAGMEEAVVEGEPMSSFGSLLPTFCAYPHVTQGTFNLLFVNTSSSPGCGWVKESAYFACVRRFL